MPYLETPDELAERIADMCGVHGNGDPDGIKGHEPDCKCRICFVIEFESRIRASVKNEETLNVSD